MCCQKAGLIGSQAELIGSLKLGNVLVFVQLIVGPLIIGELVPNRQLQYLIVLLDHSAMLECKSATPFSLSFSSLHSSSSSPSL